MWNQIRTGKQHNKAQPREESDSCREMLVIRVGVGLALQALSIPQGWMSFLTIWVVFDHIFSAVLSGRVFPEDEFRRTTIIKMP